MTVHDTPHDVDEVSPPTPRRDYSFYLVLFFFVGPIWAIAPLSWTYSLYSLYVILNDSTPYSYPLLAWSLLEVIFSISYVVRARSVSKVIQPAPDQELIQRCFYRILQSGLASPIHSDPAVIPEGDVPRPKSPMEVITKLEHSDPRAIDFRNRLRTWFNGVPFSQIHMTEVVTWLYWSSFNAPLPAETDEVDPAKDQLLKQALQLLSFRVGSTFPPGKSKNPLAMPNRLTLDPFKYSVHPLGWYVLVKILNLITKAKVRSQGATFGTWNGIEYMIRYPKHYNLSTDPPPILFLHGLGIGLAQYYFILAHLLSHPGLKNRPIVVPLQPHISHDFFHPNYLNPPKRDCIPGLLEHLFGKLADANNKSSGFKGVVCLSHSNGSYVHTWLLKERPELVLRSCFVDPVTFCSWEGDVCHNFVYRRCSTGMELLLRYIVGLELGVAHLIQRTFDWTANSLFFDEIPDATDPTKALYIIGGADRILDANRVCKYLTSHGVKSGTGLRLFENAKHGESLIADGEGANVVCDWLCEDEDSDKEMKETK